MVGFKDYFGMDVVVDVVIEQEIGSFFECYVGNVGKLGKVGELLCIIWIVCFICKYCEVVLKYW